MKMANVLTIAKKEFKDYFTSPVAYIILVILWLISGWFFSSTIFLINYATLSGFTANFDLFLVFIIPAIAMRVISDEKKYGTMEFLLTNPLKSEEIILGKFLASWLLTVIAILGTIIYPITLSFISRPDWGEFIGIYIGYILLASMYLSAGIFASSLTSQNVSAYLIGFLICFFFFIVGKALNFVPAPFRGILAYISSDLHLENITKGVIDLRDVLFFLTASFVFLFLSKIAITPEKKKFEISELYLFGIILILNYFVSFYYFRIDMTSNKIYSLSKASRKIVKNLKDPVFVKAYFNSNLPPQYLNIKKYTEDLLGEYRSYRRAKFKIEIKDPAKEKELADEAMRAGVYPIQFTSIEADKYEVKEGYMGIVFYYKDRKEVIPFIKETEGLEYLISSTIKKLVNPEKKKIGVLDEFDCTTLDDNDTVKGQFEGRFTIEKVKLDKDLGDFSALLVISPKKKIDDKNIEKLKKLIKQVPTAFFIDRLEVPLTSFYAKKYEANLSGILSEYGLKLKNGTVLDLQNQRIGVQQRRGWLTISNIVEYPPFVVATEFAKVPPTLGMERVVLPFVNAFEVKKSTQYKTTELIFSSPKSWLDTITVFNPLQRFIIPPAAPRGPFALGVSVVSDKARLIFVGTSRFIDPETVQDPANLTFFMNIIDWLVQDQDLISIRTKGVVYRPLKKLSEGSKLLFKYVNLFGNSFVLLLVGIILWRKNTLRRQMLKKIYEA